MIKSNPMMDEIAFMIIVMIFISLIGYLDTRGYLKEQAHVEKVSTSKNCKLAAVNCKEIVDS